MKVERLTVPSRIVTLAEAKAQLFVLNDREDAYITSLIAIAEETIMARTNTVLADANFRATYVGAVGGCVNLPVYPVSAVTSVTTRLEQDSTPVVLVEGTDYEVRDNGIYYLNDEYYYESVVVFTAGYSAENFPVALKGAVLMFIGTLYANRQSEKASVVEKIPYGIEFLIQAHCYYNF